MVSDRLLVKVGGRLRARWATISILAMMIGGGSLALAAMAPVPPRPIPDQGLWGVTRSTSLHPKPTTMKVCLNRLAPPPEWWTCAGRMDPPDDAFGVAVKVSCLDVAGRKSMSTKASWDGGDIWERAEYTPDRRSARLLAHRPPIETWARLAMTTLGDCPVSMRDDQSLLFIKPDGTATDPFRATKCMVDVLKTVDGVTEPRSGYARDPGRGWILFVRYTYPDRDFHKPTVVTFTANAEDLDDPRKGGFEAMMSGLFSAPHDGPDDLGAEKVEKLWRDRCGVEAGIQWP